MILVPAACLALALGTAVQDGPTQAETAWEEPPVVRLIWDPRGPAKARAVTLAVDEEDWILGEGRRHARLVHRMDEVAFQVWFEQFEDVGATRVTVAAINGFAFAGPRYFERYAIELDGQLREDVRGRHVILPRGALIRRYFSGWQKVVLSEWRYVRENAPVPAWAVEAAAKDTAKRRAFPFRTAGGRPVDLGPYNFFWHNKDLGDSHGGQGVGPFHGGPEDWLACAAGRKNRATEMLLDFQRPIWMLDDDSTPRSPEHAYWMGRTDEHEPPEYRFELDDWCPYAATLARYEFADHTHLSRGTAGAAAVARWDAFALECMAMVLADFKAAHSLARVVDHDAEGRPIPHPGTRQDNPLLFPLWQRIETASGPASNFGDRGLAHKLRLLRWCRDLFPPEELAPWERGLRELVRALADDYGVTTAGHTPTWVSAPDGGLSKPLEPPFVKTFHQQLVLYECARFGGLDDVAAACRRFLGPRPPRYFELRPGATDDTVHDRNNSADADQADKKYSYEAYGAMTHDVLLGFDSVEEFLAKMKSRGVNGASQDLDVVPREVWEESLR